ncbi:MAG: pyrroline-5-carboxylate reductase [Pseudomonadota bacterium]
MNDSTQHARLIFIGAGNMARSLIGGLIDDGYPASAIGATDINPDALTRLKADFGVDTYLDNATAAKAADVLVLATKPQQMREVCDSLKAIVQARSPLVVSIAAGIRAVDMDRWLGGDIAIVRCMPNTPALIQHGASGLFANAQVSDQQRELAEQILSAVSRVVWVDSDQQIDAVTAVSGSGPAYYFLVIEAMQAAAEAQGLSPEQAKTLVLETAFGACAMARTSSDDAATLRANVTSKGGTTAAAISVFEREQLREIFASAMRAAAERSVELGDQLGEQ